MPSYCAHCGQLMTQRASKRFCSPACRAANYRRDKTALAKTVLGVIGRDLDARVAFGGFMAPTDWRDAVRQVKIHYPAAWNHFTSDVITAAAQPLPQGVCRSCLALQDARVHGREMTVAKVLRATTGKMLVGGGCSRCRAALSKADTDRCPHCSVREGLAKMADSRARLGEFTRIITKAGDACRTCREVALRVLDQKVHPKPRTISGSTSAASSSSSAWTSAPVVLLSHDPPTSHDPFKTCAPCKAYREFHPGVAAVTAAGNFADALGPHPWMANLSEFSRWFQKRYHGQPEWLLRYRESR
jgi:hypothetical protein